MTSGSLPDNLTFEEFKALADREPNLEGDWIYEVVRVFYFPGCENLYPKFELNRQETRYFLSFGDAADFLKNKPADNVYCSWIYQVPIGRWHKIHGSRWLFDRKGDLIDYSVTHILGKGVDGIFFGRSKERQRFKEGDIVEVLTGNQVRLGVCTKGVPEVEWCWNRYNECKEKSPGDTSKAGISEKPLYDFDSEDEGAAILTGPTYEDYEPVEPLYILKPRFNIPEEIKSEMETWIERAKNNPSEEIENTSYISKGSGLTSCFDDAEDFYKMRAYFHFSEDDELLLMIEDDYDLRVSLRTDKAEYADFKDYNGRLTPNQLIALQERMETEESGKSRWWYLIRGWNIEPGYPLIPFDYPLPDYTELISV